MAYPSSPADSKNDIRFEQYKDERDMPGIVSLIDKDLSEPYSVFTYRYFINNWPDLCYMTMQGDRCVGAIICKLDTHRCRRTHRGSAAFDGSVVLCKLEPGIGGRMKSERVNCGVGISMKERETQNGHSPISH